MRSAPAAMLCVAPLLGLAVPLHAQAIGTVRTQSARVQGTVSVSAGNVTIQNNATVVAGREAAEVVLTRGGTVRVCVGSAVSLSQPAGPPDPQRPLLLGLQRGAAEISTALRRSDAIMTPDLRIESSDSAPIDLRLRVNDAGDTCLENLGRNAPILHVTEQLSGAGYLVKPGQHIVFERGSVRAVVNRATTQCGCPRNGKADDFPEEVSAGLIASTAPTSPAGTAPVQMAAGMDYNGAHGTAAGSPELQGSAPASGAAASSQAPDTLVNAPAANAVPAESHNPFAAIGRFFRRLFGGR